MFPFCVIGSDVVCTPVRCSTCMGCCCHHRNGGPAAETARAMPKPTSKHRHEQWSCRLSESLHSTAQADGPFHMQRSQDAMTSVCGSRIQMHIHSTYYGKARRCLPHRRSSNRVQCYRRARKPSECSVHSEGRLVNKCIVQN